MRYLFLAVFIAVAISCAPKEELSPAGRIVGEVIEGCLYIGPENEMVCPFNKCAKCPPTNKHDHPKRNPQRDAASITMFA